MPAIVEGDFPSNSFIISDVSEVLSNNNTPTERRKIPAGVYSMQVCNVLPREYYDKPDCYNEDTDNPRPDAIAKRLIPLEAIDGKYANERHMLAVYMEPDEAKYSDDDEGKERYGKHRTKYRIGCENISKLAQACGLNSIADFDDCAGKFVKVTLKKKDGWVNLDKVEKYGIAKPIAPLRQEPKPVLEPPKPEPAVETATEEEVKDDIPF